MRVEVIRVAREDDGSHTLRKQSTETLGEPSVKLRTGLTREEAERYVRENGFVEASKGVWVLTKKDD